MRRVLTSVLCAAVMFAAFASPARAANVTYLFSSGSLSASVQFVTSGTTLTVTVTNTGAAALVPADVLTAVFFNCSGCGSLTPGTAISSGPTYVNGTTINDTGKAVGGEWAYSGSIGGGPGGATQGISSSGFGFFGDPNFAGTNLDGPNGVDGLQYGIVNGVAAGANQGVTSNPLTGHDVIFTLTCSQNCTNATFGNISVQYGTSLTEPNIGGGSGGGSGQTLVPEPTSLLLFGSGLAATAYRARRKKNQKNDNNESVGNNS